MSLRNFIQDSEADLFMGLDTTSPLRAMKPGYVRSAMNCYPGLFGGVIKRGGATSVLSAAWAGLSVTQGIEFLGAAGSRRVVLFGTDGGATGGKCGFNNAGTMSEFATGLSGTARPSFAQFGDLLFFYNGADSPFVYDGAGTRQVGITAPISAPTIVMSGGTGLINNSSYQWAYTYYNSVTGAESSPSPFSASTNTGSDEVATLAVAPGDSDTADTIRVYRTYANGNQMFLEGTAAIGATSFVSDATDAELTDPLELDNSRIEDFTATPNYPLVARQRVFLKSGRNELRYSKYGLNGPMPESFEVKAYIPTVGSFGSADDVIGISKAGDTPIVLKEQTIGSLIEVGNPNNFLGVDNVQFFFQEISASVGAVSHQAAQDVLGECIFLSRNNIYGTRGAPGDLRPVANSIQSTIKALSFLPAQITKISSINDKKLQQVLFAVFTSTSETIPAYILVGDYQLYPEFRWTVYCQGEDATTHPAWKVGCFFTATNSTDGTQEVMFGNAVSNGQYYQAHSGADDPDDKGIYFEIITRPYAMKAPANVKLFKDAQIEVQGDGSAYNFVVSSIYDLSGEEEGSFTISLSSGGAIWDTDLWDVASWATNASPPREYPSHRKAKYQQLVFRQTSANAPITLFNWLSTASLFRYA